MTLNYLTGADEATSILLTFPTTTPNNVPEWKSQAIAMTNMRVSTDPDGKNTAGPAIRIQGTKGEIQVEGPSFRPERYHIISCSDGNVQRQACQVEHLIPQGDRGMYWEADEVARCVKAGKLSSDGLPWDEMIAILEVMDEARRQGGLEYPESIEGTHYSAK
jgi:predicted dehydrogenase